MPFLLWSGQQPGRIKSSECMHSIYPKQRRVKKHEKGPLLTARGNVPPGGRAFIQALSSDRNLDSNSSLGLNSRSNFILLLLLFFLCAQFEEALSFPETQLPSN